MNSEISNWNVFVIAKINPDFNGYEDSKEQDSRQHRTRDRNGE